MIREIIVPDELEALTSLLRRSFATVARQFDLTEQNAGTNPAFMTVDRLHEYLKRPVRMFALVEGSELVGCVAVASSDRPSELSVERLAVLPEHRHHGHGDALLSHAVATIAQMGGRTASLAIINENRVLKSWYESKGFREVSCKRFEHLPFEVCFMSMDIPDRGTAAPLR